MSCLKDKILLALVAFQTFAAGAAEVKALRVRSAAMNRDVSVNVVLPKGYGTGSARYPTVYLLHGRGNDQSTYAQEPILSLVDRHKVIAVCPFGGASWWMDSPRDPSVRYETFVVGELLPFVDRNFRTLATRRGRAIAGHSMGGHGACFIGFRHKDVFGAVGNVMGCVDLRAFPKRGDLRDLLGPLQDYPEDWERHSSVTEAAKLKNGELQLTTIVGTEDFFFSVNRSMHDILSKNGVAHVHMEVRGEDEAHSSHTRVFAYESMSFIFARFSENFRANCCDRLNFR